MKKIILIVAVLSLWSCATLKKKETEKISSKELTSVKNNDSIVKVEVNKAINDLIKIQVDGSHTNNAEFDSLVNSKVDEILEKINLQKQSGDNQYQISYNRLKRQIEASIQVGETKNASTEVKKIEKTDSKDSEYISTYIKKIRGIPFYWYIIAFIFVFRKQILELLCLFFPVLRMNKIFSFFQGTSRINELEARQERQHEMMKELLTQTNPQ